MGLHTRLYHAAVPRWLRRHVWDVKVSLTQAISILSRKGQHPVALRLIGGRPLAQVNVNGLKLYVDIRDLGVAKPLCINGSYEATETAFLARTLKPGMTVVDIGANIGYYTTFAARTVGPSGCVVAFEPDPDNFSLLKRNVTLNRLSNVHLMPIALGSAPAEALLRRSQYNYGDHRLYGEADDDRESVRVPVDTLDAALRRTGVRRVDVVKMDVQGFEHMVITGMTDLLGRGEPLVVLSEFWPGGISRAGGSPEAYLRTFQDASFSVSILTEAGELLADWKGLQLHLPSPQTTGSGCDEQYVNLVFRR